MSARPVALVTGASSGIGAALADRLARDGHDLIVVARRRDRLEELADRLQEQSGSTVTVLTADLATDGGIRDVEPAVAAEPGLALVVNNAGFSGYQPFLELDLDVAEQLIRIHCVAPTRISRAALPGMIQRGRGAILNIASLLAFSQSLPPEPLPYRVTYAACKGFMVTFTVALRHELQGSGVRAVVCCPGIVESEFHGSDYRGPPGMKAEDVATACVKALAADEAICAPGLEDPGVIEELHAAQRAMLMSGGRATELAPRYRDQCAMRP